MSMEDRERFVITICGGGNLSHVLAAVLGARPDCEVRVLTRSPERWGSRMRVLYRNELELVGTIDAVSNDPASVIPGSDIVLVLAPAFAHRPILERIAPHLSSTMLLGALPGGYGFDWVARRIAPGVRATFGVHRTPYICRMLDYGSMVAVSGVSPELFVAAIPATETPMIAALLERLLVIRSIPVDNYLTITLTPTNPIFHPSRLYSLFRDWKPGVTFDRVPLFYGEWDDAASTIFERCSDEIQAICRALPLDMSRVVPVMEHYGVGSIAEMSERIRRIDALHDIEAPMIASEHGFVPDLESRFFTEDIPYGLAVIRGIAGIARVPTPAIDTIITWAQGLMGTELLVGDSIAGRDTEGLPLPANMGIATLEELTRRSRY
jgi:opine dehydrogenase